MRSMWLFQEEHKKFLIFIIVLSPLIDYHCTFVIGL